MLSTKQLVIFDCGDVIWDECEAKEHIKHIAIKALSKNGILITNDGWDLQERKVAKSVLKQSVTKTLIQTFAKDEAIYNSVNEFVEHDFRKMSFNNYLQLHPIREGMYDLFLKLSNDYLLVILANQEEKSKELIEHYKLDKYFSKIYLSCDYKLKKPDIKFFELILNDFNVKSDQCYIIGNKKQTDLMPAAKLGMNTIQFICKNSKVNELDVFTKFVPDNIAFSVKDIEYILGGTAE